MWSEESNRFTAADAFHFNQSAKSIEADISDSLQEEIDDHLLQLRPDIEDEEEYLEGDEG